MFKRVRLNVIAATDGEQTPWSASSLTGDFSFVPGGAVVAPVPSIVPTDQPTRAMVRQAQEMLAALGYDPGPIDGDMGRHTTAAVTAFQQSRGLPVDGLVSDVLLQHLRGEGGLAPATNPSLAVWDRIASSDRAADFERFLAQYPTSPMAGFARDRLAELSQVAVVTPPPEPEPAPPTPRASEMFRDCSTCPEMVVVPAGSFQMGSPSGEYDREPNEGPQHRVSVRRAFAVGKYEVTNSQWNACISGGGCRHRPNDASSDRGNRPVIHVSWDDAQEYVRWLSRETGHEYRLLSEAEWEYAARAGTQTARNWGSDIGQKNANCAGCGSRWDAKQTAPVGSFAPNSYGLYDMLGNVWEWVQDCYYDSYSDAPDHSIAWQDNHSSYCQRAMRGGSWNDYPWLVRSAARGWNSPVDRSGLVGFRVARDFF
jgi:formylglycine-generating enzyme required for sulfatase activity